MKAWIRTVGETEAEGDLKRIYEEVRNKRGSLSNVMKAQGLDPESIHLHLDLYLHLMYGKSTVTRLEREMIAVVVSSLNNCGYCVTHHTEGLSAHSNNPQLQRDLERAVFDNLSRRDRAMLDYAVKLTDHPEKMAKADVDELRTAGLSDEEILRVTLITGYFNFVNRIVSGLGVGLEDDQARVYNY